MQVGKGVARAKPLLISTTLLSQNNTEYLIVHLLRSELFWPRESAKRTALKQTNKSVLFSPTQHLPLLNTPWTSTENAWSLPLLTSLVEL